MPNSGTISIFTQDILPFSFIYDGKPSGELLKDWKCEKVTKKLDENRIEHAITYTDPKTGLEVHCVAIEYQDFPTVEWTIYFKNTGKEDTPILKNIQAIDLKIARRSDKEFLLHHGPGSTCVASDYMAVETILAANESCCFAPIGGRPTSGAWPYYNLEFDGGGTIFVVGWAGQWASNFNRDGERGLRISAGQEVLNTKLHPGESVRSPRIVIQHYRGDWIRSQNIWRHWMMAHNMPHPGGKLPKPMLLGCSSGLFNEMVGATEANQIMCIDRYLEEGIKLDYWWMDAGWYPCGSWLETGTWEVDTKRFPNGLKAISDHAHSKNVKTLLWFEPERVYPGTWLATNHPEWLCVELLDLGIPEARQWLTDHVDRFLTEQGIDLYRQDFNTDPLRFWRKGEAADRQGITENKYVVGYLKYWDELLRRHPDMLIDSCAGGGRRNELETIKRAVPLWRSDFSCHLVPNQGITYGISLWIPYHGTGVTACSRTNYSEGGLTPVEPYAFWSTATPAINFTLDIREKGIDYPALRELIKQWRAVNQYYDKDYYPLLPYSLDEKQWIAWQFHDDEKNEGVIQAFRRSACENDSMSLKLHGLKPGCRYTITDLDSKQSQEATGQYLMSEGLIVKIPTKPGVVILVYR